MSQASSFPAVIVRSLSAFNRLKLGFSKFVKSLKGVISVSCVPYSGYMISVGPKVLGSGLVRSIDLCCTFVFSVMTASMSISSYLLVSGVFSGLIRECRLVDSSRRECLTIDGGENITELSPAKVLLWNK